MNAILEDVRRLEAAREKGEVSEFEYAVAKSRLLSTVEEATVLPPVEAEPEPREEATATPDLWGLALIGLICAGLMTFLTAQLTGNVTVAFTLVTCICAAIVIAAFRRLES